VQRLEREYKKETLEQGISSKKFPYAVLLIRSNSRQQVERGIKFLEEIRREKSDDDGRAALYYLALAQFRLGNYLEARQHIEALLQIEPKNRQANAMKALVNEQITKGALFFFFFFLLSSQLLAPICGPCVRVPHHRRFGGHRTGGWCDGTRGWSSHGGFLLGQSTDKQVRLVLRREKKNSTTTHEGRHMSNTHSAFKC